MADSLEAPSTIPIAFRLAGEQFSLSASDILAVTRAAMLHELPLEAQGYHTWFLTVDGVRLNVKWIMELATGLSRRDFTSNAARDVLRRMGLAAQHTSNTPMAVENQESAVPPTVEERDRFYAEVIHSVQTYLHESGLQGVEPKSWPRSHNFQLRMAAYPGCHYEVAIHRGTYEIGLHFESSQAKSHQRLEAFVPHAAQLTDMFGEPIRVEVWQEEWARVYVEYPLHELAWHDSNAFGERVGRFIEVTYPYLREAYANGTVARRRTTTEAAQEIHAILDREVDAVRLFLRGRADRPRDEKLCDWVHFCYTFELYDEASQIFGLINPEHVNDWYFERTKRLARICTMRSRA